MQRRSSSSCRSTRTSPGGSLPRGGWSRGLWSTSREALDAVVGNRLPRCGRVEVLAVGEADARVLVEGAHAHAVRLALAGRTCEQRRAAGRAEHLREAALGLEGLEQILALGDAHAPRHDLGGWRRRRAAAALAARAVAVAGLDGRLPDREAHAAAEAGAGA